MSSVRLSGNAGGTGIFTIASPNSNSSPTMTLPDGTGTLVANNVNSAIVSGTAVTASSTAVDFTGIPSWVKRITVMFQGVSTNGTSIPQIQLGTSGGFTTSGYLGTAIGVTAAGTGATNYSSGALIVNGAATTSTMHGAIRVSNITGNVWVFDGVISLSDAAAGRTTAGSISLSGTLTQIRITTVNGTDTFDAGTINILYE